MNQVQRYLFWWVCGAALLVLLILMVVYTPKDDAGDTPEDVKGKLDAQVKKLDTLHKLATTPLQGTFDVEDPVAFKDLTTKYLITARWKGVLDPAVAQYQQQLEAIAADLSARSAPLNAKLVETTSKVEWQNRYLDETETLLKRLDDAGQMLIPEARAGTANRDGVDESARYREDDKVRKVAGFETPRGTTFSEEQQPLLTARLAISRAVIETLLTIEAAIDPNPAVNRRVDGTVVATLPPQKPKLVAIEWTRADENMKDGPLKDRIRKTYLATIRLQGVESSLLAMIAKLEQLDRPVVVVAGARLGRMDVGKRLGDENQTLPAQATIELLAVDMTQEAK